ncbi:hypothetical protein DL764_003864 [Monosporascus ibericus]|uniref:Major facilitator superfamily (MFS) profile domain-containing protein n=1 Tax=Monosporascus ibericus TaxID=155417 RepID=A0A4Q4TEZ1_9PEZI|nr:hypothetical protein DL764_003864 [Monosporascus ibericus]
MSRLLPFGPSTTALQAATYLLGISLFSIAFLVFLNSAVSFVVTDLLGIKKGVGDIVGTLGFVDEVVALIACPAWGLASDRLGVRWVAVLGYVIIGVALCTFVQARSVAGLVVGRVFFALGASAAATMVTAALPVLTGDGGDDEDKIGDAKDGVDGEVRGRDEYRSGERGEGRRNGHNPHGSVATSLESDATITPARFTQTQDSNGDGTRDAEDGFGGNEEVGRRDSSRKPSALAGYVGLFTGCGALVALLLFLPLPAQFSKRENVTPALAITYSFYVVGGVAFLVASFVFFGFHGLRGEEEKGWRMLMGLRNRAEKTDSPPTSPSAEYPDALPQPSYAEVAAAPPPSSAAPEHRNPSHPSSRKEEGGPIPYRDLLLTSLRLGFTDPDIALGYLGGFVARASTVAISLFVPLYVNAYFLGHGFCSSPDKSPNDPDLKRECRAAYVLASALSGVAQLVALLCAPAFGYASGRGRISGNGFEVNAPVLVAAALGVAGYAAFPRLASPEFRDIDGRGGSPAVFLVVALLGISQIGAIVCSLGSLGRGVLGAADEQRRGYKYLTPERDDREENGTAAAETDALLGNDTGALRARLETGREGKRKATRVQLKGSIAGVYSLCGGAAILLLTKLGGFLFDVSSRGAPFYMMAAFNAVLLVASLAIDMGRGVRGRGRRS